MKKGKIRTAGDEECANQTVELLEPLGPAVYRYRTPEEWLFTVCHDVSEKTTIQMAGRGLQPVPQPGNCCGTIMHQRLGTISYSGTKCARCKGMIPGTVH